MLQKEQMQQKERAEARHGSHFAGKLGRQPPKYLFRFYSKVSLGLRPTYPFAHPKSMER